MHGERESIFAESIYTLFAFLPHTRTRMCLFANLIKGSMYTKYAYFFLCSIVLMLWTLQNDVRALRMSRVGPAKVSLFHAFAKSTASGHSQTHIAVPNSRMWVGSYFNSIFGQSMAKSPSSGDSADTPTFKTPVSGNTMSMSSSDFGRDVYFLRQKAILGSSGELNGGLHSSSVGLSSISQGQHSSSTKLAAATMDTSSVGIKRGKKDNNNSRNSSMKLGGSSLCFMQP